MLSLEERRKKKTEYIESTTEEEKYNKYHRDSTAGTTTSTSSKKTTSTSTTPKSTTSTSTKTPSTSITTSTPTETNTESSTSQSSSQPDTTINQIEELDSPIKKFESKSLEPIQEQTNIAKQQEQDQKEKKETKALEELDNSSTGITVRTDDGNTIQARSASDAEALKTAIKGKAADKQKAILDNYKKGASATEGVNIKNGVNMTELGKYKDAMPSARKATASELEEQGKAQEEYEKSVAAQHNRALGNKVLNGTDEMRNRAADATNPLVAFSSGVVEELTRPVKALANASNNTRLKNADNSLDIYSDDVQNRIADYEKNGLYSDTEIQSQALTGVPTLQSNAATKDVADLYSSARNTIDAKANEGTLTDNDIEQYRRIEELYKSAYPSAQIADITNEITDIAQGAQEGHTVAGTVGKIMPSVAVGALTAGLTNAQVAGQGLKVGGANLLKNTLAGTAIDTGITGGTGVLEDIANDESGEQIAKNLGKTAAMSFAGNLVGEGISAGADKLLSRAATEATDNSEFIDKLSRVADQYEADRLGRNIEELTPPVNNSGVIEDLSQVAEKPVIEEAAKETAEEATQSTPQIIANGPVNEIRTNAMYESFIDMYDKVEKTLSADKRSLYIKAEDAAVTEAEKAAQGLDNTLAEKLETLKTIAGDTDIDYELNNIVDVISGDVDDVTEQALFDVGQIKAQINKARVLDLTDDAKAKVDSLEESSKQYLDAVKSKNVDEIVAISKKLQSDIGKANTQLKKMEGFDKEGFANLNSASFKRGIDANAKGMYSRQFSEEQAYDAITELIGDEKYSHAVPANDIDIPNQTPAIDELNVVSQPVVDDLGPTAEQRVRDMVEASTAQPTKKQSKIMTDTFSNDQIMTQDEMARQNFKEMTQYLTHTEKESIAEATEKLSTSNSKYLNKYTSNLSDADMGSLGASDIDAMMMLRNRYTSLARQTTDSALKQQYFDTATKISSNLQKASTRNGQAIQALAKWSRTGDGAIATAEGMIENSVENSLDGAMKAEIKQVSDEISNNLRDIKQSELWAELENGTITEDAQAGLRGEISKAVDQVMSAHKKVQKKADVSQITDEILATRQYDDIAKTLEYMSTGHSKISPEVEEKVLDIFDEIEKRNLGFNSKERVKLENEAYAMLADAVNAGGSIGDKLNTWRYMSMLSNTRTHIKNIAGNFAFKGVTDISDNVSAMAQQLAQKVSGGKYKAERAIYNPFSKEANEIKKAAKKYADDVIYRDLADSKISRVSNEIMRNAKAFGTKDDVVSKTAGKAVQKIADANTSLLNAEDYFALKNKYATSMIQRIKAAGKDASIFTSTDAADKALLSDFSEKAIKDAKYATFHNDSKFADALSQFSRNLADGGTADKVAHMAIEATMPFKKTPINIVKAGADFSPIGFGKAAWKAIEKGHSASEIIDDLAKGTTGTAGLLMGAWLYSNGVISAAESEDDNKKYFDEAMGKQAYSLNLSKGGKEYSYTIDELSPAALPVLVGAQIAAMREGDGLDVSGLIEALAQVGNPLVETTMLSGLASTMASFSDDDVSDTQALLNMVENSGINYATQMVPTALGQVARTIDPTRRRSDTVTDGAYKTLEKTGRKMMNRIPGLSQLNEPYINQLGDEEYNTGGESVLGRAFSNFISPGYLREIDNSDIPTTLDELYKTQDESVYPTNYTKTITTGDGKVEVTPEQRTEYERVNGAANKEGLNALFNSDAYKNASDEEKANLIDEIYKLNNDLGNTAVFDDAKIRSKYYDTYLDGGYEAVINALEEANSAQALKNTVIESGFDSDNNSRLSKAEVISYLESTDMSPEDKKAAFAQLSSAKNPYDTGNTNDIEKYNTITVNDNKDIEELGTPEAEQPEQIISDEAEQQSAVGQARELINAVQGRPDVNSLLSDDTKATLDNIQRETEAKGEFTELLSSKLGDDTKQELEELANDYDYQTALSYNEIRQSEGNMYDKLAMVNDSIDDDSAKAKMITELAGGDGNFDSKFAQKAYDMYGEAGVYNAYKYKSEADAAGDGNGRVTKAEAISYLNSRDDLDQQEKANYFSVMASSRSKNPYGTPSTTRQEANVDSTITELDNSTTGTLAKNTSATVTTGVVSNAGETRSTKKASNTSADASAPDYTKRVDAVGVSADEAAAISEYGDLDGDGTASADELRLFFEALGDGMAAEDRSKYYWAITGQDYDESTSYATEHADIEQAILQQKIANVRYNASSKYIQRAINSGLDPQLTAYYKQQADTNGNGRLTKAEVSSYVQALEDPELWRYVLYGK